MKSRIFLFMLLAGCLLGNFSSRAQSTSNAPPSKPAGKDSLLFLNGDILLGELESIRGDKIVTWRRGDVAEPIEFSGTNLFEIHFSPVKQTILSATNGCRVALRNGDLLEGKLLQFDSKQLVLDTSFAGKLTFPREVIERIEPLPPEHEPVFSGPTGLDGWIMGKVNAFAAGEAGQWKYTNGAFYATRAASIARDLKLPDVARIEFDLAWKGVLQSAIALYTGYMQPVNLQTKDAGPDFGGFYSLQINSFVSALMRVKKDEPLKYMEGQVPIPAFSQKNQAHIELLVSKPKHSVALLVDGALVKEWVDKEGFAGTGTGMRFVHQGQGAVKLSNLRIAEWNGKMRSKSTDTPAGEEDVARLLNGDKVSGKLEIFRDGKLLFSTPNGKLAIPFERISESFLGGKSTQATDEPENVRAFFHDGGRISFHVERWDAKGILAESPNFGRATFAPESFERAQLNPASGKMSSDSAEDNDFR